MYHYTGGKGAILLLFFLVFRNQLINYARTVPIYLYFLIHIFNKNNRYDYYTICIIRIFYNTYIIK